MAVSARKGKKASSSTAARHSNRQKATAARKRKATAKAKALSTAKKAGTKTTRTRAAPPPSKRAAPPPPAPVGKGANKEYYVERIVKERPAGRGKQYLVRWEGYPPSDDSWLSAASLAECVALDVWQSEVGAGVGKKGKKSSKR